jgi:hypothetical protein
MALVAVWLTVLVPTVSRTAAAAFVFPDLGAWCEASPAGHHDSRGGHTDAGDTTACGYCTLFAQSPALGTSFFSGHVPPLPDDPRITLPATDASAGVAVHHASPRGPPVVAHA